MFLLAASLLASCGSTSSNVFGQVEDDAYYSRKASHKQPVYVPEVDVQEIIKENPPQYGQPQQQPYNNGSGNSDFNYNEWKARQQQQDGEYSYEQQGNQQEETFLTTVPYEEGADEASRLRQQYYGNYNTYNYNYYGSMYDPLYSGWGLNSWYAPVTTFGIGWNSWGGWNAGFGWGWRTGWGYGWPHYNPYWGGAYGYYNPWGWGWNTGWYSPYGCNWGWNSWGGPVPYANWGYSGFAERVNRSRAPRQAVGSNAPRGNGYQPRANGMQAATPANPRNSPTMPRNASQGQIVNRNGEQIYVAPQQSRTMPRSYGSYNKSVEAAQQQRDAAPPSQQQPRSVPRPSPRQAQPSAPQNQRNQNAQPSQPQQRQQPRSYSPSGSQPAPQRNATPTTPPRSVSPPSGGGGFGGGSSGGGGGRPSMPRPR